MERTRRRRPIRDLSGSEIVYFVSGAGDTPDSVNADAPRRRVIATRAVISFALGRAFRLCLIYTRYCHPDVQRSGSTLSHSCYVAVNMRRAVLRPHCIVLD